MSDRKMCLLSDEAKMAMGFLRGYKRAMVDFRDRTIEDGPRSKGPRGPHGTRICSGDDEDTIVEGDAVDFDMAERYFDESGVFFVSHD